MNFISYGLTKEDFRKDKVSVRNRSCMRLKPGGGFWACPVSSMKRTWKQFCIEEDFQVSSLKKSFIFSLKSCARIFYVHNVSGWQHLINKYGNRRYLAPGTNYDAMIDFTKMAHDYDAIYFHAPKVEGFSGGLYSDLFYGAAAVDVESICIFNPDIINY